MQVSLLATATMCFITLSAGIIAGSLTLIPLLIIICFGIPCSLEITRHGAMKRRVPLVHCAAALVLLLAVFTAATWGCCHFLCRGLGGYITGILVALIIGLYQCTEHSEGIADYWRDPAKYRDPKFIIKASQFFLANNKTLSENTEPDLVSSLLHKADYSDIIK